MDLNLLIVEDSVGYAIELEQIASQNGFKVVGIVDNSADALDFIFSNPPDIILMDIQIKGKLNGIEVAKIINHLNIPILYITSFNDDTTYNEALQSNLVGYIVKPVDKLTLTSSLKLLIKSTLPLSSITSEDEVYLSDDSSFIYFMKNNVYQKIIIDKIEYVLSDNNYCNFIFDDKTKYFLTITLSAVEEMLKHKKFIRCHRQYIVNQKKIRAIDTDMNTLELSFEKIPFSRRKKAEIMNFGIFLK